MDIDQKDNDTQLQRSTFLTTGEAAIPDASPVDPESEQIQLLLKDKNLLLRSWTSYTFASDYMNPAAGFSFTLAVNELPAVIRDAVRVSARVRLIINDVPICDGHIDTIQMASTRSGGTLWTIQGRERLALAVDAVADPTLQIIDTYTLAEALKTIYGPLGWNTDEHFEMDSSTSRNVLKGLRGTPLTRGKKRKPLKSFVSYRTKPHNHEGLHAFAQRMAERHGFWIRCSEDGERIIVDTPDYNQPPSYLIRRVSGGLSNVIEGNVTEDFHGQPSLIIADGQSNHGEYGHGRIKSQMVHPYFGLDARGNLLNELSKLLASTQDFIAIPSATGPVVKAWHNARLNMPSVPARIVYLHDEESQTQQQLHNFVRRQMSTFVRKAFRANYTVPGHGQIVNGQFVPWMVNTVCLVQDEVADIEEPMWVSNVSFTKSRGGGTTTSVELLLLNAIDFGEQISNPAPEEARKRRMTELAAMQSRKKLWDQIRREYGPAFSTLVNYSEGFREDVLRQLDDPDYRAQVLRNRAYWRREGAANEELYSRAVAQQDARAMKAWNNASLQSAPNSPEWQGINPGLDAPSAPTQTATPDVDMSKWF